MLKIKTASMRTIRIINDIVIYFCFCFLAGTGLMMEFSFVKGAGPQYVLSMGKKAWETGHFWVGVVAILAFILHFCLNSRFFKNVLKTRIVYVLFVIIGFGGAILLAVWPTEKGETAAPAAQTSAQAAGQGYGKGMGKGMGKGAGLGMGKGAGICQGQGFARNLALK